MSKQHVGQVTITVGREEIVLTVYEKSKGSHKYFMSITIWGYEFRTGYLTKKGYKDLVDQAQNLAKQCNSLFEFICKFTKMNEFFVIIGKTWQQVNNYCYTAWTAFIDAGGEKGVFITNKGECYNKSDGYTFRRMQEILYTAPH